MTEKADLQDWVFQALESFGGSGTIIQVATYIWKNHHEELLESGDLFYTWQYDMRWAATQLRKRKIVKSAETSPRGEWQLI